MSSGVYALLGVLLGGLVTVGASWFQTWRTQRAEWLVANRLLTDELERLMVDLSLLIQHGVVPPRQGEGFLDTSAWEQHSTVIARALPNNAKGDKFWRELSRMHTVMAHHIRPWLREQPPGGQLPSEFIERLRPLFDSMGTAYKSLTGDETDVRISGALPTGAQDKETAQTAPGV
jgi:hypothetical protein